MIIKQIEIGFMDNFSYLVGCKKSRQALVIDPGGDAASIVAAAEKEQLKITMIVNTHGHGDHTAGNAPLKALADAPVLIHQLDADRYPIADRILTHNDTRLQLGELVFDIIHTPGHTPGGICLYAQGNLFTGDTLFVGDSGRTDLDGGHRPTLGASIRRLMALPDDTVVWPGHDYGPCPSSTIGWEKRYNVNAKEYGFYRSAADGET
jgi:glyoxylase-like metal-dependent hydrolase (beta-lactamase superfamily II)